MESKNFLGFLFLVLVLFALLLFSGILNLHSLWPAELSKGALRWRLAWMLIGAAIAFVFVWGKKLAPDKALWAAIACLIFAYLLF